MGFKPGKRIGKLWNDVQKLNTLTQNYPFHTTGKNEQDFEKGFSSVVLSRKNEFTSKVIAQIDKSTTVQSVYCFGKKHRPDLTLDEDGVAIELKFMTYDGLKDAIGQGHLYRLKYKFVFLILIVSEEKKQAYLDLEKGEEKDMEDILNYLSETMNIFTYVVPAFNIKPGIRKCVPFFPK